MVSFTATIRKFEQQGEKTGWTYIDIPADIAGKLKPGQKTSFRVKGKLDKFPVSGLSLLPMGGGRFIIPLNAKIRKGIGKRQGAMISVKLEEDKKPFAFNRDFISCLEDDPEAHAYFGSLPGSHQRYFSKWIDEAKTEATRTRRIAQAINALSQKHGFPDMLRMNRKNA